MEIKFLSTFTQHYSDPFKIRPEHVRQALQTRDSVELVKYLGLQLVIFYKRLDLPKRKYYLLSGGTQQNDQIEIHFAFKIPNDILNETPLLLLQNFIQRYGVDITIGKKTAKFFLKETIAINSMIPQEFLKIQSTGNYVSNLMFMIENNPPRANCALVFCINTDIYLEDLKNKNLI